MLVKPENQHLIRKIRTARASTLKPTSFILRRQPTEPWEPLDFALLEALTIIESETCNSCGNFIWLCDWPDRDVQMKSGTRLCHGARAIRQRQNKGIKDKKQQKEDAKGQHEWGVSYYSYPELDPQSERTELPTRREYYAKKQELNG